MPAELLITDLTCALPASGWTDADSHVHKPIAPPTPERWRVIDYRGDLYQGRMLQTVNPTAPVLTIPLGRSGWHAISIGLYSRLQGISAVEVRLTGDERWQLLGTEPGEMHEEPWIFADLTGADLEIRFPHDLDMLSPKFRGTNVVARVASVRAVPLTAEHARLVQERRHRPMVYINDGHGIFGAASDPGPHIVENALGHFADSDWDICCFGSGGADLVNYPSRVGTRLSEGGWQFMRPFDGDIQRILNAMLDRGEDPLKQAIDQAHTQGHRCWIYNRPQAWVSEQPFDHAFRSRFYVEHPEFRCVEADGTAISKLSIAYTGVRKQLNTVLAEALERGADGLALAFVRGYPLVRYERPVAERYRELYGRDVGSVPDTDVGLRQVWAEFVTTWMREIRRMLDGSGPSAMSARRELVVFVGPSCEWNARFGLDVGSWAHEGLLDAVIPYPLGNERTSGFVDVAEYARLLKGTGVQLLPSLGSYADHGMTLAQVRQRAHAFYQAGATGLARWDTDPYLARVGLDDPVAQALWCEHYMGSQAVELDELQGLHLKRFPSIIGL